MPREFTLITGFLVLFSAAITSLAEETEFLTGAEFEQRMETQGSASLSDVPLREVLERWSSSYDVACFRDRRVDPEQTVESLEVSGRLRDMFHSLGEKTNTEASLVGNVVYLGPRLETRLLRTLIVQRTVDLQKLARQKRNTKFTTRTTVSWPAISEPKEVIQSLAASFDLTITNSELIEHDLWNQGTLPEMTIAESLSVLLLGFRLTFEFSEDGKSITLVSLPTASEIAISNTYRLKSGETTEGWQAVAPAAEISGSGQRITVRGLVEDHEAIRNLRDGTLEKPAENISMLPLSQRLFTLTIQNIPASAVLEELRKTGVRFIWDPNAFQAASINLQDKVSIDVKEASAEKFFAQLLGPLGIECELSGATVTMRPGKD